jgi:hypothetical protein
MRLLNTKTRRLEEFIGENIPSYAILSHRWESEEVTFKDLESLQDGGECKKKGYSKIQGCCNQAVTDGYEWVWIDSCCIDKSSSAELSEAINSMFRWYKQAQVCYAYLSDVGVLLNDELLSDWTLGLRYLRLKAEMPHSKWFQRGWALQEFLAPKHLEFFDRYWQALGTKDNLKEIVSEITGIMDIKNFMDASVAQKMSWASNRETTRIEDRAYSLFGLFGVNLPPLYGEGQNAFLRLQLEILRMSDDESIFSWIDSEDVSGGLLARSPSAFKECGGIKRKDFEIDRPAYLMTNKGLRMEASLLPSQDPSSLGGHIVDDTFCVDLNCKLPDKDWVERRLKIMVRRLQGDQYARISTGEFIHGYSVPPRVLGQVLLDEKFPNLGVQTRNIIHVKQRDDGESPFRGPYTFNIPIASLIEKGLFVSQKCLTNKYRSRWERGLVGEERLKTATLGPRGVAAALIFATPGEVLGNLGVVDAFALVVNAYDHRAEMKIIGPGNLEWHTWLTETVMFREFGNLGMPASQKSLWSGKLPRLLFHKRGNLEEEIYDLQIVPWEELRR